MNKRNDEVEAAIKAKFGKLAKLRHDEKASSTDYWADMRAHLQEGARSNPDRHFSTETPWMDEKYKNQVERVEALHAALKVVTLRPKAKQIITLFMEGHNQTAIATIVGVSQAEVSRQLNRIGKKLKKIMTETV